MSVGTTAVIQKLIVSFRASRGSVPRFPKLVDGLRHHGTLLYDSYRASEPLPTDLAYLKARLNFVPIKD